MCSHVGAFNLIILDDCTTGVMHIIEFDLGLVVKEDLACLEWKVFPLRGHSVLFSNQGPTWSHSAARTQSSD